MKSVNCSLISIDDLVGSQPMACNALIDNHNVPIIVLRNQGVLHVYQNQCPHQGRRLDYAPGQFLCNNGLLICAAHGASFALDTGLCTQGPCRGESLIEYSVEFYPEKNAIRVFQKN